MIMGNAKQKTAREAALELIRIYQASDWEIKEETETHFTLKKNTATTIGHVLVFIFLGWWNLGLANFLYHLANRRSKRIVK